MNFKKITLILGLLLVKLNFVNSVPVKLPCKEVLSQRFYENELSHFMEKTTIVQQLADKSKEPSGVALILDLALYDYSEYNKNPMMDAVMHMRRKNILEIILKDYPEELKELKANL